MFWTIHQNIDTQLCMHVKTHHHHMNYHKLDNSIFLTLICLKYMLFKKSSPIKFLEFFFLLWNPNLEQTLWIYFNNFVMCLLHTTLLQFQISLKNTQHCIVWYFDPKFTQKTTWGSTSIHSSKQKPCFKKIGKRFRVKKLKQKKFKKLYQCSYLVGN